MRTLILSIQNFNIFNARYLYDFMVLDEYYKKRNFSKTTEPKEQLKQESKGKPIYVIQRHDASHLHYDLRLEMGGVLKSWAVPKEPPMAVGVKRLAVLTEDHPIEYANFEGKIPEGEYGAGKVEIWDKGDYELLERTDEKIIFSINGEKLKGKYCLILLKKSKKDKNWLFFKAKE